MSHSLSGCPCVAGLQTGTPKAYITLKSGNNSNVATFYDNIGKYDRYLGGYIILEPKSLSVSCNPTDPPIKNPTDFYDPNIHRKSFLSSTYISNKWWVTSGECFKTVSINLGEKSKYVSILFSYS